MRLLCIWFGCWIVLQCVCWLFVGACCDLFVRVCSWFLCSCLFVFLEFSFSTLLFVFACLRFWVSVLALLFVRLFLCASLCASLYSSSFHHPPHP